VERPGRTWSECSDYLWGQNVAGQGRTVIGAGRKLAPKAARRGLCACLEGRETLDLHRTENQKPDRTRDNLVAFPEGPTAPPKSQRERLKAPGGTCRGHFSLCTIPNAVAAGRSQHGGTLRSRPGARLNPTVFHAIHPWAGRDDSNGFGAVAVVWGVKHFFYAIRRR